MHRSSESVESSLGFPCQPGSSSLPIMSLDDEPAYLQELECLKAIYAASPHDTLEFESHPDSSSNSPPHLIRFTSFPVLLSFGLPPNYPEESPIDIRIDSQGVGMSRLQLFELEMRLGSVTTEKKGELVLFDLTVEVCEFAARVRGEIYDVTNDENINVEEEEEEEYEEIQGNRLDSKIAMRYMDGQTIDSIMKQIGSSFTLVHAEVVLRRDLLYRFDEQWNIMRSYSRDAHGRRAQDAAADRLSKTEVVFHGTLRQNIGSIVRSGFVVPGSKTRDDEVVDVRCGSTWGMGIYTSPDPSYSLCYSDESFIERRGTIPGQKLIVCAALLGRRKPATSRHLRESENYDSLISPSNLEYVIFNPAQLLPLFVLHLKTNSKVVGRTQQPIPRAMLPQTLNTPSFDSEDPKERQRLLTALARKHLPDGFGPRGSNFVVEAIASVDDDEEMWGEYQNDGPSWENRHWNELDEFQQERYR